MAELPATRAPYKSTYQWEPARLHGDGALPSSHLIGSISHSRSCFENEKEPLIKARSEKRRGERSN